MRKETERKWKAKEEKKLEINPQKRKNTVVQILAYTHA